MMKEELQRDTERSKQKEHGFTLIELLVTISIIVILAGILFPVFARARESARRASCLSNLKQVGMGFVMYTQDYDEQFPPAFNYYTSTTLVWWQDALQPYVKTYKIFVCPSNDTPQKYTYARGTSLGYPSPLFTSYAINESVIPYYLNGFYYGKGNYLSAYVEPSKTILVLDCTAMEIHYNNSDTSLYEPGQKMLIAKRHLEGANFVFADGHAKWLKQTQVDMWRVTAN